MYAKGKERRKAGDFSGVLVWFEKAAEQRMQKYKMAQSYYDELQEEMQKQLTCDRTTRIAEVKKKIDEARRLGDLSENEAYCKMKAAEVELRVCIEEMEKSYNRLS